MDAHTGAIVVGYDGSADSDLALAWGDDEAAHHDRSLHVIISEVDRTQALEVTADWHAARMAELETDVKQLLSEARSRQTSIEVARAPAAPALIEASGYAALVVLGARGHSLLSGALLGSVSQHVTRHAACPVVVTRQPYNPQTRRVVVGVDGSAESRKALAFAIDHADRIQGPLTVVHGWGSLRNVRSRGLVAVPHDVAEETAAAERLLSEAVAGLTEQHPDVAVSLEAIPVPPGRLLADASQDASLVVVGSRGRGAFAELLLGSVSQSVLHHARCPVAVIR
jgi:nucleotide-binding universal stress UspA family protein